MMLTEAQALVLIGVVFGAMAVVAAWIGVMVWRMVRNAG